MPNRQQLLQFFLPLFLALGELLLVAQLASGPTEEKDIFDEEYPLQEPSH